MKSTATAAIPSMLGLAHRAGPAEDAFGHLSISLRNLIAEVACLTRVDRAPTPLARLGEAVVLRNMRCDVSARRRSGVARGEKRDLLRVQKFSDANHGAMNRASSTALILTPTATSPASSTGIMLITLCTASYGIQRQARGRGLGSLRRSARVSEHRAHFARGFSRVGPTAIAEAVGARLHPPHRRSHRESRYRT
jgi:hypothetical protein